MKTGLLLVVLLLAGCAYEGKTLREYFHDPRLLIKDPHFVDYKKQRDALESQYLRKEISYVEYVREMDKLDTHYAREVQKRNRNIEE